jgi:DNA-binding transcriptional MerR regulator
MTPDKRLLPTRALRARYGRCTKTIGRWVEQGILPPPVRINGNRYWYEHDLEKLERAGMGAAPVPSTDCP